MTIHKAGRDVIKKVMLGDDIEFSGFEGKPQDPEIITGQGKDGLCLNRGLIEKISNDRFEIRKSTLDGDVKIILSKEELKAILNWLI